MNHSNYTDSISENLTDSHLESIFNALVHDIIFFNKICLTQGEALSKKRSTPKG